MIEMLMLAQGEVAAKAAQDLLNAKEVLPFFQAALLLAGVGVLYFFYRWQTAEKAIDAMADAQLQRAEKMIARLTGVKEGDSRA